MGRNFVVIGGPTRADKVDRLVKDPKAWARALTSESELAALDAASLTPRREPTPSFGQVLVRVLGVATLVAAAAVVAVFLGWTSYVQLAWIYLGLSVVVTTGFFLFSRTHGRLIRFGPRPSSPWSRMRNEQRGEPYYSDARDEAYGYLLGYHRDIDT